MQFKTTAKCTLYLPSLRQSRTGAGIDVDHEYYVRMPLARYHSAVPIILLLVDVLLLNSVSFERIILVCEWVCVCVRASGIDLMRQQISPDHINLIWKFPLHSVWIAIDGWYLFAQCRVADDASILLTAQWVNKYVLEASV